MALELSHWFPIDIIREILLKATVKSLLRCKSVCKEWYSLISDQRFIKSHYTSSSTNITYAHHRLIYKTGGEENSLQSCPLFDVLFHKSATNNVLLLKKPSPRTRGLEIVGSCNGLVCLFVEDRIYDYDLYIYNPSTRIWNRLPFRKRYIELDWFSFGYDESTGDYKIVKISTTKEVNIYSLKTGKWKILGLSWFSYDYQLDGRGIFLNGALHWMAVGVSSYTHKQKIVSLDLAKETYGEVLQFEYVKDDGTALTVGALGDLLCVLCKYNNADHADLWVMKVYGVKDSWTKLASFSYLTDHWIRFPTLPLFISKDEKVLFASRSQINLVIYNLKDSSLQSLQNDNSKFTNIFEPCTFVESLVSPFPPLALVDKNED